MVQELGYIRTYSVGKLLRYKNAQTIRFCEYNDTISDDSSLRLVSRLRLPCVEVVAPCYQHVDSVVMVMIMMMMMIIIIVLF